MELGLDTRMVLLASGLMFLWALGLGVVKYRQMTVSEAGLAHPYTDTAHRAALLYSFALLLVATFVELSAWPTTVNSAAAGLLVLFFAIPVAVYMVHGLRRDTDNQWTNPPPGTHVFMFALIIAEVGSFSVLLAGFMRGYLFT
jgi:hypothetical protein